MHCLLLDDCMCHQESIYSTFWSLSVTHEDGTVKIDVLKHHGKHGDAVCFKISKFCVNWPQNLHTIKFSSPILQNFKNIPKFCQIGMIRVGSEPKSSKILNEGSNIWRTRKFELSGNNWLFSNQCRLQSELKSFELLHFNQKTLNITWTSSLMNKFGWFQPTDRY